MINIETVVAVHPSEFLKDSLELCRMTQKDLAKRTNLTEKTITAIMRGKDRISPETALKFEKVLDIPASFLIQAQSRYDEYQKRLEEEKKLEVEQVEIFKSKRLSSTYSELVNRKLIEYQKKISDRVTEIQRFFGIVDLKLIGTYYESKYGMLWKPKHDVSDCDFIAWIRCGELLLKNSSINDYDSAKFQQAVQYARSLAYCDLEDVFNKISDAYKEAGVFLVWTPKFKASRAYGFTEWVDDTPVIHLSLRGGEDEKWHALFHETKHVMQNKKTKYFANIDNSELQDDPDEKAAHEFAVKTLLNLTSFDALVNAGDFSKEAVISYSTKNKIHPAVVVAQLQRRNVLRRDSSLNHFKKCGAR